MAGEETALIEDLTHRLTTYFPEKKRKGRFVLYWMQASVRIRHNLALAFAVQEASKLSVSVEVIFCVDAAFPEANERSFAFLLDGLADVQTQLNTSGVPFTVAMSGPVSAVAAAAEKAAVVVFDRGYLPIQRAWRNELIAKLPCPVVVAEDNVSVPIHSVSDHEEWTAATLRPKLMRAASLELSSLSTFENPLKGLSPVSKTSFVEASLEMADVRILAGPISRAVLPLLRVDSRVPATKLEGGETEALRIWKEFRENKLERYDRDRNDPNLSGQSGLAPYLHFGQLSPLTLMADLAREGLWHEAVSFRRAGEDPVSKFLDESLVRRELSVNFVYYNPDFARFEGLPAWARKSLLAHRDDRRDYLYGREEWEEALTHDSAWNAAQTQLRTEGTIPGYMRMYWGKKILEWSRNPESAFETALYLNNKYALDGRDANSFAGVAWCFGKHDRPWGERAVYGNVRCMTEGGLKKKFDLQAYVSRFIPPKI